MIYKSCGHNKGRCFIGLPCLFACQCESFHVCRFIFKDNCQLHHCHVFKDFDYSLFSFILFSSLSCSSRNLDVSCMEHPQKIAKCCESIIHLTWNVDHNIHYITVGCFLYCFERSTRYIMPGLSTAVVHCSVPCSALFASSLVPFIFRHYCVFFIIELLLYVDCFCNCNLFNIKCSI